MACSWKCTAPCFGLIPLALAVLWFLLAPLAAAAESNDPATVTKPKPAELKVSGYGILGNRELRRILRTLELGGKKPDHFGAPFVEDAALILTSRVKRDGFLEPKLTIQLRLADGGELLVNAADLLENPLPRPLRITGVHFHVQKGVLYYFKSLEIDGLFSLPEKQARTYFMQTETLLKVKRARIYTPTILRQGTSSLTAVLDTQGYAEAKADVTQLQRNDRTGAVNVRIRVEQGPKFLVRSVREEFFPADSTRPDQARTVFLDRPYSRAWVQDFTQSLKTNEFRKGFPDVKVEVKTLERRPEDSRVDMHLLAEVHIGPQVRIGAVDFKGEKRTSRSLMSRRVRIQRGELLDPIQVEEGRYRLARLGVFDSVALAYLPVDEHTRDVIYEVTEGKRFNVSLLFGYGSYELLRGGVDVEAFNLWGLAHHAELRAIQSFKSSSGDLTYTVPELVGNDIDLFVNGNGLRREEVDFTRLEYGGGAGLHKYFRSSATDASVRYNYQILNAQDFTSFQGVASDGLTNPAVGSIVLEVKHDRRDNPLYPRRGYKIFATVETGTSYLGGDANFERIEVSPSWHHPLGGGRFLSVGVSHGVDVSFGSVANNLPFNRRFFPGGENSIRGYGEGEASPYNEFGQIVGSETYTLGTVELEQALTPKWSLVLFSDSLGMARRLDNYPWDTGLFSVGGGIRWRTLIGPVRLEYGYNLNPRPQDPTGTLQFSLGFPF
jgi:outer membrane protein insertion porin family